MEALANLLSAVAAPLGCPTWIHPMKLAAGAFSLARKDRSELCPRGIVYVLGEHAAREPFDVEVFDGNGVEAAHDVERRLMMKVEPCPAYAVVLGGDDAHALATNVRPSLALRKLSLCAGEFRVCVLKHTRICHHAAIAESREGRDAHVDAHALACDGKRLVGNLVASKRDVPMPIACKGDRSLFDAAFHRAMELDLDVADACELDPLATGDEPHAVVMGCVFEREGAVAPAPFEARKTGLLAGFDAPKESPVGPVEPRERVLQKVRMQLGKVGPHRAHFAKFGHLRKAGKARPELTVRADTLLKRGVVQLTQPMERGVERGLLCPCRVETLAEHANHSTNCIAAGFDKARKGVWLSVRIRSVMDPCLLREAGACRV
jgi:hypothetical protein